METTRQDASVSRDLPAAAVPDLTRRLEVLNRRARKLNVAPVVLTLTNPRLVAVTGPDGLGPGRRVEMITATVTGESPKLAGWQLVAVLDHELPETVTRRVPGLDGLDIMKYRNAGPDCDHCGVRIRRLETFVVVNDSGLLSQVGRNCLADFLGGASPAAILWLAGWFREVGDILDEMCNGSRGELAFDPIAFLAQAAACIRVDGWLSRGKAKLTGKPATADDAWFCLTMGPHASAAEVKWREARKPEAADVDRAGLALAWARELSPADPSDYLSNLGRVARGVVVKVRNTGLLASAVSSYLRTVEEEVTRRAAAATSQHFGEVGTRYKAALTLTVLGSSSIESQYGPVTLYRLTDAEGRRFKWWASDGAAQLDSGAVYTLDATVKGHGEWKGVKETTLTRVKVSVAKVSKRKVAAA